MNAPRVGIAVFIVRNGKMPLKACGLSPDNILSAIRCWFPARQASSWHANWGTQASVCPIPWSSVRVAMYPWSTWVRLLSATWISCCIQCLPTEDMLLDKMLRFAANLRP